MFSVSESDQTINYQSSRASIDSQVSTLPPGTPLSGFFQFPLDVVDGHPMFSDLVHSRNLPQFWNETAEDGAKMHLYGGERLVEVGNAKGTKISNEGTFSMTHSDSLRSMAASVHNVGEMTTPSFVSDATVVQPEVSTPSLIVTSPSTDSTTGRPLSTAAPTVRRQPHIRRQNRSASSVLVAEPLSPIEAPLVRPQSFITEGRYGTLPNLTQKKRVIAVRSSLRFMTMRSSTSGTLDTPTGDATNAETEFRVISGRKLLRSEIQYGDEEPSIKQGMLKRLKEFGRRIVSA